MMVQGPLTALMLACGLVVGPLISASHHATTQMYGNVLATLSWTDEVRWQTGERRPAL
jgi:hypothetical protein